MEKMVILTHIYTRELQSFLNYNRSADKPSELAQLLWNGAYASEVESEADLFEVF